MAFSSCPSVYLFIYSQFHDSIYIHVYTCANGLDVGIAYICPLQERTNIGNDNIYIQVYICMYMPGEDKYRQCLRPIHWHVYILVCICCHEIVNK